MERLCRLCWKVIDGDNFEIIGEVRKEMLEVLLLKLDLPHSKETIMCSHCIEQLEKSFEFKATCLYTEDYIFPLIKQNDKIDMRQIYSGKEWKIVISIAVDEDVCRLCMGVFENRIFNTLEEVDRNMLQKCIPEVNLTFSQRTLFCKTCLTSLTCYFNFASICMEANKKMKTFFKNGSILNTPQLSVQLPRIKLFTSSNTSPVVRGRDLKNMEDDYQTENGSNLRDTSSATKDNKSQDNKSRRIKQRNKININKCAKGKQTANHKLLVHGEGQPVYECDKCSYKSKYKPNLLRHTMIHKSYSETRMYKCVKCHFETIYKYYLKVHSLVHQQASESLKLYRCEHCSYKSKFHANAISHMLIHKRKEQNKDMLYNCNICGRQFKEKKYLSRHKVIHLNQSEVQMYYCEKCTFVTRHKRSLRSHTKTHMDLSHLNMFKCEICPYQSHDRTQLKRHTLSHKKLKKPIYECMYCSYKDTVMSRFKIHILIHNDKGPNAVSAFKCAKCSYQTMYKSNLISHLQIHRDNSSRKLYQCQTCGGEYYRNNSVKRHQRTCTGQKEVRPSDPTLLIKKRPTFKMLK